MWVDTIFIVYTIQIKTDQELDHLVGLLTYFGKPVENRLLVKSANVVYLCHPLH